MSRTRKRTRPRKRGGNHDHKDCPWCIGNRLHKHARQPQLWATTDGIEREANLRDRSGL